MCTGNEALAFGLDRVLTREIAEWSRRECRSPHYVAIPAVRPRMVVV